MITLRRKTREAWRHERATVLQQLGTPTPAAVALDWRANQTRAAAMRRAAKGGESDVVHVQGLGVVMGKTSAGGRGTTDSPCRYCGIVGGHTADCPVIS